jgi:hypothetical protein
MRATEDRDDGEMLLLLQEDLRTREVIKTGRLGSLESRVVHTPRELVISGTRSCVRPLRTSNCVYHRITHDDSRI